MGALKWGYENGGIKTSLQSIGKKMVPENRARENSFRKVGDGKARLIRKSQIHWSSKKKRLQWFKL